MKKIYFFTAILVSSIIIIPVSKAESPKPSEGQALARVFLTTLEKKDANYHKNFYTFLDTLKEKFKNDEKKLNLLSDMKLLLQQELKPKTPEVKKEVAKENPKKSETSFQSQILNLVNQERAKVKLSALSYDGELEKVAQYHAEDMLSKNYFSHTSKDGLSPRDRCQKFNITCNGENLAMGESDPTATMRMWMNSAMHKANILNKDFTKIGIGFIKGEGKTEKSIPKVYAVQVFKI